MVEATSRIGCRNARSAGPSLPPALEQERQLLVAPDHRQQGRAVVPRLEAAAGPAVAKDAEGVDLPGQATQALWTEIGELEGLAQ